MNNLLGNRILVYEGSSKLIYAGVDTDTLILHFIKRDQNDVWRNKISEWIWKCLHNINISNHFLRTLNIREQLITAANAFPVFIRLHNISGTELSTRLGIEPGTIFKKPLIEWHLKSKYLQDPLISKDHIEFFHWLREDEISASQKLAVRTNDILRALFYHLNMSLSSIDLYFGMKDKDMMLIGELSPETITFWDTAKNQALSLEVAYQKIKNTNFAS